MNLFDSHCHLNDEKFNENLDEIIEEMFSNNLKSAIVSGYDYESSKKAVQIAQNHSNIYATIGISPNDIKNSEAENEELINKIEKLAKNAKVVGIGEIGLDYYWNKENKEMQKYVFVRQIELANKLNLPIAIHTRDAIFDTIEILKTNKVVNNGVFHCCPQNKDLIKQGLELGFYISFAGPITFKNSKNAQEIVNMVPDDRMLVETDSPYLSPEPLRGKMNMPINVKYVVEKIANFKNKEVEYIAQKTYENTKEIYKKIKEK